MSCFSSENQYNGFYNPRQAEGECMFSMEAAGKTAFVYPAAQKSSPVIYLHSHTSDAQPLLCAMRNCACGDCTLVVLQGVSWNRELTPSPSPPIVRGGEPFGGGAQTYLQQLTEIIIPTVEKALFAPVAKRGIVGYSLAGLFAVYALFHSDCFSFGGSVSGSLWYPGFVEALCTCPPAHLPQTVYFSLGRQEEKTRNAHMRPVRQRTEALVSYLAEKGVQTVFALNDGNHFHEPEKRLAACIQWLLRQME